MRAQRGSMKEVLTGPVGSHQEAKTEFYRIVQKYFSAPARNKLTFDHEQKILGLIQECPFLAHEMIAIQNIGTVFPVTFLLFKAGSIQIFKVFCERYKAAISTSIDDHGNNVLHLACTYPGRVSQKGLISFLAQQCPDLVWKKNQQGNLPIHLLVSSYLWHGGTVSYEEDILRLLGLYPQALLRRSARGRFLCEYALKHNFSDIGFQTVCMEIPPVSALDSITIYSRVHMSLTKTKTFCDKILPQLRSLRCLQVNWSEEAWLHLMAYLQRPKNGIQCLNFVLCDAMTSAQQQALHKMLQHVTNLHELTLRIDVPSLLAGTMKWDFTDTTFHLLINQKNLQSLSLSNVRVSIPVVAEALKINTTLKALSLPYHGQSNAELAFLVRVLQEDNTTVEEIRFPCSTLFQYKNTVHLEYYTQLNMFGRRHARCSNTTTAELIDILGNIQNLQQGGCYTKRYVIKNNDLNVYYGLLRELPSLWSWTVA